MPRIVRIAIVVCLGVWSLGTLYPQLTCVATTCPSTGLTTDYDGVVTDVRPASPAATAAVAPGDRVVPPWPSALFQNPPVPVSLQLLTRAGATRRIALVPKPMRLAGETARRLLAVSAAYAVFVLVGSAILLLRPSRMTWAFYIYCVARRYGDLGFYWPGSASFYWLNLLAFAALGAASCTFVMMFALRFPNDRLEGWRRSANAGSAVLAFALSAAWLWAFVRMGLFGLPTQAFIHGLVLLISIVYFAAASVFIVTLLQSHGADRQRLRWILVFPAVLIMRIVVINIQTSLPEWVGDGLTALGVCIPLSVAYAVIRRRVFDVEFAISRALVYASVTTIIAGGFLLVDWFMSKQFAQSRITLTAEIIVALAIGSSLNALHRKVDGFIDATFFRQRHLAEQKLAKAAGAVVRAESHDTVDRFLVHEPLRTLNLTSAALFHLNEATGHFGRELAVGWDRLESPDLTSEDPLVLHLLAEREPVRIADVAWASDRTPAHLGDAVLAVPVLFRDRLVSIVLYGPHRNGADIDPDEARSIALLVEKAGAAYDHIEARLLRAQVEQLIREREAREREIAVLRAAAT